jgi:hypothetical protein
LDILFGSTQWGSRFDRADSQPVIPKPPNIGIANFVSLGGLDDLL